MAELGAIERRKKFYLFCTNLLSTALYCFPRKKRQNEEKEKDERNAQNEQNIAADPNERLRCLLYVNRK